MNRRHFFQLAAMAVAGLAIDPDMLVWTPRVMITVPPIPDYRLFFFDNFPFVADRNVPYSMVWLTDKESIEKFSPFLHPAEVLFVKDHANVI